jgi:hypothetical protein
MGAVLISTPGDVSLNPSCEAAIYENLQQLSKTKQFKQVFRGGDRSANDVPECAAKPGMLGTTGAIPSSPPRHIPRSVLIWFSFGRVLRNGTEEISPKK